MKKKYLFPIVSIACALPAFSQIPTKPNIIWVMAEDMGHDLECYGMSAVKTPVLNKMASEGVLYNNACCTNPISSPSRSAMMTGTHQNVINAHNHRSNRDVPMDTCFKPITYYLRQQGYTCILGNTNVMSKGRKTDCNFKHEPIGPWDGVKNFGLFDRYDTISVDKQPFFAQIQLVVTHRGDWWKDITKQSKHPVNPDSVVMPPYLPRDPKICEEWASYLDQVEYMDAEMGKLLDELKSKGLLDNTIIFFIGDNGRCEVKGKGYLYEPGLKIPMIAWGKGIPKQVVDGIVSTLDIDATILDLAGGKIPSHFMGKPLFNKSNGKSIHTSESFYGARDNWDEVVECSRSITTDNYKYIKNYMPEQGWDCNQQYLDFNRPAIHVLRKLKEEGKLNKDQLLFMQDKKPVEELYDILADPDELHNLAADKKYKKVLKGMRARMAKWQKENVDHGLLDRNNRVPEDMGELREFVKKAHPDEWKKITEGEICTDYGRYNREYKQSLKSTSSKK